MIGRKIEKGIILAAGDGDRLGSLTLTCPKVLLSVCNEDPLIKYPIESLAAAGIREIVIVVGYLGHKIKESLCNGDSFGVNLKYIENLDYLGGNAISAFKAREWAKGEPVVLCMGDHLIDKDLIRQLLDRPNVEEVLCVDHQPVQHHEIAEATKVAIDSTGCIKDIGKNILYWDALDTGVFLLTDNFFQATQALIGQLGISVDITDVVRFLISQGYRFNTCDVTGCFWMDVDTEEDLKTARL